MSSSDENYKSPRPPGSREEDAWLSDKQLARCAPAETEPFQSPVPTRMVSNGEYMPHPQTREQKHVEHRVQELAAMASKKLGISRREFLGGSGGLAAAFMAMNEVYGKKFFKVSQQELFEPAAAHEAGPPDDLFVFDDQTHIVRDPLRQGRGLRALAQGPGLASYNANLIPGGYRANPYNGLQGDPDGLADGRHPGLGQPDRRLTENARSRPVLSGRRKPQRPGLRRLHAVADRQLPPRLVEGLQHRQRGQDRLRPEQQHDGLAA